MPPAAPQRISLYRRLLGQDYGRLPQIIQDMHDVNDRVVAQGFATIERPGGGLARLTARALGMPPPARTCQRPSHSPGPAPQRS